VCVCVCVLYACVVCVCDTCDEYMNMMQLTFENLCSKIESLVVRNPFKNRVIDGTNVDINPKCHPLQVLHGCACVSVCVLYRPLERERQCVCVYVYIHHTHTHTRGKEDG